VTDGMSVRAVEEAARQHNAEATATREAGAAGPAGPATTASPGGHLRPPGLLELEELLSAHLDTRVAITMGASRGKVTIDFATLEDLERIYRAMTTAAQAEFD
jgi:ParB family chromosome partitioning protein